jgi:hypothetical protein
MWLTLWLKMGKDMGLTILVFESRYFGCSISGSNRSCPILEGEDIVQ